MAGCPKGFAAMSAESKWMDLNEKRSPYTDWFDSKERNVFFTTEEDSASANKSAFITRTFDAADFLRGRGPDTIRFLSAAGLKGKPVSDLGFATDTIPFLADTVDPDAQDVVLNLEKLPEAKALAARLDSNAVLTGVIDVGISPFHERFRATDATTRIISCWQQAGKWTRGGAPFGSEITAIDIDVALKNAAFDEETALRTYHVSRPEVLFGSREVDFRAAHGTHIADLAAGAVPCADPSEKIRNPILAVNMPPRYSHGSAGNFLEFFAFAAVVRIVDLADQLWQAMHNKEPDAEPVPGGFPLVINLSFGMKAGAKDGSALFERLVQELVFKRDAPTDIVMPVGNDNLFRGTARAIVGKKKSNRAYGHLDPQEKLSLDWRVPPSDRSSNFMELWFPPLGDDGDDVQFRLIPPGTTPTDDMWHCVVAPKGATSADQYMDALGGAVRIYRGMRPNADMTQRRPHIVIGLMPTEFFGSMADPAPVLAPAGLWKVEVSSNGVGVNVYAHIQSDQDIRPGRGRQAIRSYFDDCRYDTHTNPTPKDRMVPTGMPQDSVYLARAFDNTYTHLDDWHEGGPVQRKGTNNAIATAPSIIVIGAYRVLDQTAAAYSATVEDELFQEGLSQGRGTSLIEALLPGDDGPMHLGILGAGSRSGSAVAFQGTSSSSALAARAIVDWRLSAEDGWRGQCTRCFIKSRSIKAGYGNKAPLKIGNGLVRTEAEDARHTARMTEIQLNPYL
jgi:hypothetical protein